MKKFKNTFAVTGPVRLLKAFIEEVEEIGWIFQGKVDFDSYQHLIFREHDGSNSSYSLQEGHFWLAIVGDITPVYDLTTQWKEAVIAANETKETIPEYVRITKPGGSAHWYYKQVGEIYKVVGLSSFGDCYMVNSCDGIDKRHCVPVTKEEFERVQPFELGGYAVRRAAIETNDGDKIMVILAGCEIHTPDSLKLILRIMVLGNLHKVLSNGVNFTRNDVTRALKMIGEEVS